MDLHQLLIAAAEALLAAAPATGEVLQAAEEHAPVADPGVLGTLGVNWKLFLAQLFNFGLVLLIFWKWIMKPITDTLAKRQERIESGLKNAEAMDAERKNFETWKQNEMKQARGEAENVIKNATDYAATLKQELTTEAQKQSEKLIEQAKSQISVEKQQMLKEVKQEVATLVVAASEKILRSKLDAKKDHELIAESLKSIR